MTFTTVLKNLESVFCLLINAFCDLNLIEFKTSQVAILFVFKRTLPNYIFHPKTQADKQLKIEFYRYICELIQKIHLCSSINAKLLLYSIEHFDGSNKIKLK